MQGNIVTMMRKQANVPYPNECKSSSSSLTTTTSQPASPPALPLHHTNPNIISDASHDQATKNPAAYKFNCAQRAHTNLLENMNQTIAYMLFAGLAYPQPTAALGLTWVLSRSLYAYGYVWHGKRYAFGGGLFWLSQGALWGLCGMSALKML
jgi:hypothetical protein